MAVYADLKFILKWAIYTREIPDVLKEARAKGAGKGDDRHRAKRESFFFLYETISFTEL